MLVPLFFTYIYTINFMQSFLSINHIFFTFLGYQMSYIEFFGTLFNIWSVWLVAKNKILNWPIGLVGTVLFTALFWQIHLYSDFLEQIYYFITGIWGWWAWSQVNKKENTGDSITTLKTTMRLFWIVIITIGTLILGYTTSHVNIWLPTYFPTAASFAYLDAFTTVVSFVATILLIRKKIDAWYLWILIDIIGIWLYWVKGVHFVSLLYIVFLVLATKGLFTWINIKNK